MTIDIGSLPLPGDNITEPLVDELQTDIMKLILEQDALQNPLRGDLDAAIPDLQSMNNLVQGSLSQSNIQSVIDNLPLPGPTFTMADRLTLIDSLVAIKETMQPYESSAQTAVNGATSLLDHSELMCANIPSVNAITSGIITAPKTIVSDIEGGLPSDFPGLPDLAGIPAFNGIPPIPNIPDLGLNAFDAVPGTTSAENLPGVNLPGVPDAPEVLRSFSGSVLSEEFGGAGLPAAQRLNAMSSAALTGATPLAGVVDDIADAGSDTATLTNLALSVPSTVSTFTPPMQTLADPFGGVGGGASSLVASEQSALFGGGCTEFETADINAGSCSTSDAISKAGALRGMLDTQTGASLLKSVSTPALSDLVDF